MQTMKNLTATREETVAELASMHVADPTILVLYLNEIESYFKMQIIDEELYKYMLDIGREVMNREIGIHSN